MFVAKIHPRSHGRELDSHSFLNYQLRRSGMFVAKIHPRSHGRELDSHSFLNYQLRRSGMFVAKIHPRSHGRELDSHSFLNYQLRRSGMFVAKKSNNHLRRDGGLFRNATFVPGASVVDLSQSVFPVYMDHR